jgi:hypothetical protein
VLSRVLSSVLSHALCFVLSHVRLQLRHRPATNDRAQALADRLTRPVAIVAAVFIICALQCHGSNRMRFERGR